MRPTVVIASTIASAMALSACGATLWPNSSAQVKSYAPDVYACVQAQATNLGYHSFLSDSVARTYEGRRESKEKNFLDVDQVGAADRLKIKVVAPPTGTTSTLQVSAQTISIRQTKEGRIEEAEPASSRVVDDAKTIVTKCAPSSPATT
jgi:beta-mannanase